MTIHPTDAVLNRHLDGELTTAERWETEAHLRTCDDCRRRLAVLRRLVEAVEELPAEVAPEQDLWPAVAARIAASTPMPAPVPGHEVRLRRPSIPVYLAWAGAVAASLILGLALGRQLPRPAGEPTTPQAVAPAAPAVLASFGELEYDAAIADLETILVGMRDQLRPETVAALETNLAIIDTAITEAREALLADPANEHLHRHLAASRQTKLQLLRMVTSAVTADI